MPQPKVFGMDVEHIPIAMVADNAHLERNNLGVGDEVFITGPLVVSEKCVET